MDPVHTMIALFLVEDTIIGAVSMGGVLRMLVPWVMGRRTRICYVSVHAPRGCCSHNKQVCGQGMG
eukprot:scaffold222013_cov37-Attheya_sp.AAC.1